MDNINIDQKVDSPKVILDYTSGLIEFDGNSYLGNASEFYEPSMAWIKEYCDGNCQERTTVNIKLGYFNSATNQIIYTILDIFQDCACENLEINWHYNPDNEDAFEDYKDIAEEFPELKINPIINNSLK